MLKWDKESVADACFIENASIFADRKALGDGAGATKKKT